MVDVTISLKVTNKVRTLRVLRDWSADRLASEAGISVNTVYQAESMDEDRLPIRAHTVKKLAAALGVNGVELAYLCLPVAWVPASMMTISHETLQAMCNIGVAISEHTRL